MQLVQEKALLTYMQAIRRSMLRKSSGKQNCIVEIRGIVWLFLVILRMFMRIDY